MSYKATAAMRFLKKFEGSQLSARRMAAGATLVSAFGLTSGYLAAHTALINKYKETVQYYRNGFPVPMKPQIVETLKTVVADMNLSDKYQQYLKIYYVTGFDPYFIGSFKMRFGAYLGIPIHFSYENISDIDKKNIMVDNKPVIWESEGGQLLASSLLLSPNAHKFILAREINSLDTYYVYINMLLISLAIPAQYVLSSYLNSKTYGFQKSKRFRLSLYSLVALFIYSSAATISDIIRKHYEKKSDHNASELGESYARGGVEYYSKIMTRNIGLRELMGGRGERLFSKFGNYNNEILRQRHVPFSARKERLEERVKEYVRERGENVPL